LSCVFCGIVERKIPGQIVYETADVLAFNDVHPQAPVHVLVIPKKHIAGMHELVGAKPFSLESLFEAAKELARRFKIEDRGYRLVINHKSEGGQTVGHLHLHLLGGRQMNWPPG
jgi:histidine triad (HIT) family protein